MKISTNVKTGIALTFAVVILTTAIPDSVFSSSAVFFQDKVLEESSLQKGSG
jgi:hypothetical protein